MQKNVQINISLVNTTEEGVEHIASKASGCCIVESEGVMLRYVVHENNEQTTLVLTDALADMQRKGDIQSRFTFIEGRLLPVQYATTEGQTEFDVFTHSQAYSTHDEGGNFKARYTLLCGGRQIADNELNIEWRYLNE